MSNPAEPPNRRIERRSHILTGPLVLALVGVVVIVAGGVVWAFLARAPERVDGQGIVMPRGDAVVVRAPQGGLVYDTVGAPGDVVRAGQPLLRVQRPDGTDLVVRTPAGGTVVEVRALPGSKVATGDLLAILNTDRRAQTALGYMPAGPGESIAVGMPALVSPGNLPMAQYGAIEGTVTSVAPTPASTATVRARFLGNDALVGYFTSQGPVLEIRVRLRPDASTPSGFKWTVGSGPDERVSAGTLATVSVITNDRSVASTLVR